MISGLMESVSKLIATEFDISKMKKKCNVRGCNNSVDKEFLFYDYKRGRKFAIASIYLCRQHETSSKEFLKRIKKLFPKAIISFDVKKI